MLISESLPASRVLHWHQHTDPNLKNPFQLAHRLDDLYDILYSGSFFFNFYLNILHKFYAIDKKFNPTYQDRFNKMFEVARWLHDWSVTYHNKQADLIFDDLISNHLTFFENTTKIQQSHNLPCIDLAAFNRRRLLFFETCVKSATCFENFDNMTFVIFVLAWLERQGSFPHQHEHFIMNDIHAQDQCKQFALDNYQRCPILRNFVFEQGTNCPDFLINV